MKIEGVEFVKPKDRYRLLGRDGKVDIEWDQDVLIPVVKGEYIENEAPDYDIVGRGIFKLLRRTTEHQYALYYASILKEAYPHIISEIGGEAIMLDSKDVDTPYIDRKIANLKIMSLIEPEKSGIYLEIARSYVEKGSRIAAFNLAVNSWYEAEKWFKKAVDIEENYIAKYELGEVFYTLGRYNQAIEIWGEILASFPDNERRNLEARITEIVSGRVPKVPPLDYLTAISVALEERENGNFSDSIAIIEDVLLDELFTAHFPVNEIYYLLGTISKECGLMEKAAEAFKRS